MGKVIFVSSKNPAKIKAVHSAASKLFPDSCIRVNPLEVDSGVSSKPVNEDVVRGALNRSSAMRDQLRQQAIPYDYLVSIEGGYDVQLGVHLMPEHDRDRYFGSWRSAYLVDFILVEDASGLTHTLKSTIVEISPGMLDAVRAGESLNACISKITGAENNKHGQGVGGYLSGGILDRASQMTNAIYATFCPFVMADRYNTLDQVLGGG